MCNENVNANTQQDKNIVIIRCVIHFLFSFFE